MAARAGILETYQDDTETPREFMKCAKAEALCRAGFLERISKHLYRRRPVKDCLPSATSLLRGVNSRRQEPVFIPESLPSPEIGGIRFDDPQKAPNMPRFVKVFRSERLRLAYELGR